MSAHSSEWATKAGADYAAAQGVGSANLSSPTLVRP